MEGPPPVPVLHSKPLCLASPGNRYVVYLSQGGTATLELAGGDYKTRWFNPRSGRSLKGKGKASGPLWTSPPAPDEEDWALLIERR